MQQNSLVINVRNLSGYFSNKTYIVSIKMKFETSPRTFVQGHNYLILCLVSYTYMHN